MFDFRSLFKFSQIAAGICGKRRGISSKNTQNYFSSAKVYFFRYLDKFWQFSFFLWNE